MTPAIPIHSADQWKPMLQQRGWCILDVPVSFWDNVSSADHGIWLDQPSSWQSLHRQLFDSNDTSGAARYVGAESGGGTTEHEPKRSWELRRSDTTSTSTVDRRLRAVMDLLHAVAVHVNATCFESGLRGRLINGDATTEAPPFDLLRAFCYEPTDAEEDTPVMGSMPHTDWGSFTVVWQDTVGGLQTWDKGEWTPVPCDPPSDAAVVRLVVHVGDVTSLVTGYPSPRHRVVAPASQRRHSFVYFVYPEPQTTLRELQRCWGGTSNEAEMLGYEHYSLLQDQSPEGVQSTMTARGRYNAMMDQPLAEVFQHKWSQVQR